MKTFLYFGIPLILVILIVGFFAVVSIPLKVPQTATEFKWDVDNSR